jgi:hypothetical protein
MDPPESKDQQQHTDPPARRQYSSHFFSHGDTLASVAMRHKMELDDLLKVRALPPPPYVACKGTLRSVWRRTSFLFIVLFYFYIKLLIWWWLVCRSIG